MSALHLRHWPGDTSRPALALHCMMGSASYWGPIAKALDGRVDLRAPDLPSHGRSPDWPGPDPDYHTFATRAVAALIDRPLDLIGHSFGATIALRIAVAAPEAVRSLTLIEPVLFAAAPDDEQEALFARMHALLAAGDREEAAAAFLTGWGMPAADPTTIAPSPRQISQLDIVAGTNDALHLDTPRILRPGGLESIDAPVLFIMGEESPKAVPAIIDALAERLADVGRASVPGAGHMLPVTHPNEVAGLIAVNLDRA